MVSIDKIIKLIVNKTSLFKLSSVFGLGLAVPIGDAESMSRPGVSLASGGLAFVGGEAVSARGSGDGVCIAPGAPLSAGG